ncbi:tyrosine-type recombinase/integrase [Rubrivivax gelatinosus]|uniref:tyrosine-type recombinase/integrase n=1 Tax=Rubrivivax gelatinosus TaxID=28068 RepID=UPI0005C1A94A|nr:site-specific integrase [Rubrivivax gelatinosus]MBG6083229.1 site-specific recombinase XerD [Rubrivivax gelatinosus]
MALVRFTTPDLFSESSAPGAASDFARSFAEWLEAAQLSNRFRRDSTAAVYEDMWGAFMQWALGQDPAVQLDTVTATDLLAFIVSRKGTDAGGALTSRYAFRVLSLIDDVLAFRAKDKGVQKNDAAGDLIRSSPALRQANLGDRPELDYLDAEQARRLVVYLSGVRAGAAERRRLSGWQELRNLTAVALHLGAGLTAGEVREMPLDAPLVAGGRLKDVPWKLKVPGNGNRPARETPVAPWAGQLLRQWLEVRAAAALPREPRSDRLGRLEGPFLLPGRSGQQWGKVAHYDAVKAVLEAAGIDDPGAGSGGSFRLRHTFAIRQLKRKKQLADVARWMGIANPDELERYRRVIHDYEDVA